MTIHRVKSAHLEKARIMMKKKQNHIHTNQPTKDKAAGPHPWNRPRALRIASTIATGHRKRPTIICHASFVLDKARKTHAHGV